MIFDQVFPKYFHISHVSRICQGFNYITHFTMFTMFHNIYRKICPKCFVKYCALILAEMTALLKFRFAATTLAVRIPFATMLTAANLSQSYQMTTHCTSEFASIHSISKPSGHPATLPSSVSKEVLLIVGCLAYQNSRRFFSFLQISCSLA